ncbi:MAG: 2-amino-4-hydroxy-6-hydroxymethyldihydropteridine diphosphokinase [Luteolibacter sp.]
MARTGIALGSNLGDRAANLRAALDGLREISTPGQPVLAAALYETAPVGCPDGSPAFLNTVVEIDWVGEPLDLLGHTRALESRLGRTPNPVRNAPRLIDIDILYCGDATVDHPDLLLPHPRMTERLFVLMPLADIRPDFQIQGLLRPAKDILNSFKSEEPLPTKISHPAWPATHASQEVR